MMATTIAAITMITVSDDQTEASLSADFNCQTESESKSEILDCCSAGHPYSIFNLPYQSTATPQTLAP